MNKTPNELPFTILGTQLKSIRQDHKQSLAEVSGAVEIGIEDLNKIESGANRPSEDILLLLINYFKIKDDEAIILWRLAGYDEPLDLGDNILDDTTEQQRQLVIMLALDTRIAYSDGLQIDINDKGLVLNFSQQGGLGSTSSVPIARVGMSNEQAKEVLEKLQNALLQIRFKNHQKLLSQPKPRNTKNQNSS